MGPALAETFVIATLSSSSSSSTPATATSSGLRIAFALPGLHRIVRGAEVAFESVARELARIPGNRVTLIGSGHPRPDEPYTFTHAGCISREHFERFPHFPLLRDEYTYEELSFLPNLLRAYRPADYDITVACSYPFTNWALRGKHFRRRPAHVYVTQNADWPAQATNAEYRFFSCDGLVCTNPDYYERNQKRWLSALIPNGVDPQLFSPAPIDRAQFDLPTNAPVAVMVSALIPSKRVLEGIRCAAQVPNLHLRVAGDGPLRDQVDTLGRQLMPNRFRRLTLPRQRMPDLYRAADLFLHMSMDEPSANAYIEALATGLPIVTHNRNVTRWTLEDTAMLVDTADEPSVVYALQAALGRRHPKDVAARRALVEKRFAWSTIAQQYQAFFLDVCRRRNPHAILTP